MGIHDRDYYRDDEGSFLANWSRNGQVIKTLIAVTVVVFVLQLVSQPRSAPGSSGVFTDWLVLISNKVMQGQVWRLVTCGFLHSTERIWHILFNMLILWFVGREMEERYGSREFLTFYLLALVASSVAFIGSAAIGINHTTMETPVMGASGAVTAALILFVFNYPHRRILLFFVIPMPVWALGVIYVGQDLIGLVLPSADDKPGERVAFAAHLGGAAFGALYFLARIRLTALIPSWSKTAQRAQPRLRVRRDEEESEPELPDAPPPPPPPKADPDLDEHLEAQLDAVLAKMAKHGQGSLSSSERAILHRASEVYRRRRR